MRSAAIRSSRCAALPSAGRTSAPRLRRHELVRSCRPRCLHDVRVLGRRSRRHGRRRRAAAVFLDSCRCTQDVVFEAFHDQHCGHGRKRYGNGHQDVLQGHPPLRAEADQPWSTPGRRTPQRAATPERPRPTAGSPSAVVRIRSRGRRAACSAATSCRSRRRRCEAARCVECAGFRGVGWSRHNAPRTLAALPGVGRPRICPRRRAVPRVPGPRRSRAAGLGRHTSPSTSRPRRTSDQSVDPDGRPRCRDGER